MGDRANVYVTNGHQPGVYLYTHWGGTGLPQVVARALARGTDRWNDDPYLARIIFSEMIKDEVENTTGYGISAQVGDGEDRIITVDTSTQTVTLSGQKPSISFSQFSLIPMNWYGEAE